MGISKVGIVGGGQMGGGIAEVCVKAGVDVIVVEVTEELATSSKAGITRSLDKAVDRGKLDSDGREAALDLLTFTTDLGAFVDRELVIEAVVENLEVKRDLFARIDSIVTDPDAILASNTSSIPITQIALSTTRPQSVVG
ncbi:MAG: 3-hydroxyacyl-CoA dehydrogenase NAD-binding domain-containing protein, partial [Actinomycetia bacterium]|nr:3-hydroxyacyl-CoA dehydrogenase NAD-binding domain-containing protein [Actinomycetes bacterium]